MVGSKVRMVGSLLHMMRSFLHGIPAPPSLPEGEVMGCTRGCYFILFSALLPLLLFCYSAIIFDRKKTPLRGWASSFLI